MNQIGRKVVWSSSIQRGEGVLVIIAEQGDDAMPRFPVMSDRSVWWAGWM